MVSTSRLASCALLALVIGAGLTCGGSPAPVGPSTPFQSLPQGSNIDGHLDVAVVVDPSARELAEADYRRILGVASDKLRELTGETLAVTDFVWSAMAGLDAPLLATGYVASLDAARVVPPEAVVVATHDTTAHTFGGYSMSAAAPTSWGFVNEYASPTQGTNKYYLVAVEFTHPYARCGYDDNLNHVSDVSIGGECRNRSGQSCVALNGRWVCPDALNDLYMNSDYFTACSIVHEIVHPFGSEGNYDHYGTAKCTTRTGMSPAAAADLRLVETYCGMCPDVYKLFRRRAGR